MWVSRDFSQLVMHFMFRIICEDVVEYKIEENHKVQQKSVAVKPNKVKPVKINRNWRTRIAAKVKHDKIATSSADMQYSVVLNCRGGWQKFQTLIKWGGQYKMRGWYFDRIPIKWGGGGVAIKWGVKQ